MIPRCIHHLSSKPAPRKKALSSFFGSSKNTYATEVSFETKPYRTHKLDSGPSTKVTLSKKDAIEMYKSMTQIRRLETSAASLYKEKVIRGFCHLYSGQEACCVGIKAALRPQDTVITAYRAHGWTLVMGGTEIGVLAELGGRKSGCARGKGGSMHMYGPNFYGGNGIVGAQGPLGAGIAFAHKYNGTDAVSVTLYGDGAANQGQLFEAYNICKLWSLPVIYVCENNGFGMGTSAERAAASTDYFTRGDYVPGLWVDGMDVLAVREAARYAVKHCASGKGPIILETATYRYHGHSMSDPGTSYRTREEIQQVRQTRDPITLFREKLIAAGLASADELKTIEKDVRAVVDEAAKKTKTDPEIGLDEMPADVYSEPLRQSIRGVTPWDHLQHKNIGPAINK